MSTTAVNDRDIARYIGQLVEQIAFLEEEVTLLGAELKAMRSKPARKTVRVPADAA